MNLRKEGDAVSAMTRALVYMRRKLHLIPFVLCAIFCFALFAGCSGQDANSSASAETSASASEEASVSSETSASSEASTGTASSADAVTAVIQIEGYDPITVELDPSAAPKTVENFVKLANDGFYNGLTFHRIMDGFMMQGGDPTGTGMGGSDTEIEGEFSSNGVDNPLSHTRGAISMARSSDPNSASSQFFIVQSDSTFLDGDYAAFGYVQDGMDVVDAICAAAQPTDNNGTIPAEQQPVIESIIIQE